MAVRSSPSGRGLFIEKGNDQAAVEQRPQEADHAHGTPGQKPEPTACLQVDGDDQCQQSPTQDKREQQGFEMVGHEGFRCGSVETESLFDHKGVVHGKGKVEEGGAQGEDSGENQGEEEGMTGQGGGQVIDQGEAVEEEHGHHHQEGDFCGQGFEPVIGVLVLLLPCIRLGIKEGTELFRKGSAGTLMVQEFEPPVGYKPGQENGR